ncbi:hypothetical protein GKA01_26550 [Gluconobacter kanchanaburiensis NBRC 103587]|uniref:Uncharacterized protein n=1 Tax=Gluconobacter kanchanaburiensis NBRC 103587 TaxID=1307948 RepID=A0A511BAL9_9PROT|nr:hypothetical protein AA103587_2415 [Gluconobacter kanchanaburiensis NBRC 103587]GEK97458.1 hypothetical protein GKA01_26550 [Gluconobacter kanchanaburiensis NBRC 103587]
MLVPDDKKYAVLSSKNENKHCENLPQPSGGEDPKGQAQIEDESQHHSQCYNIYTGHSGSKQDNAEY